MAEFHNLGRYLKEKRIEAGLTQIALAEKLGLAHSQFVSNWERGLCAPPNASFQGLISLLKLNRGRLMEVMMEDSKTNIAAKVYRKSKTTARK